MMVLVIPAIEISQGKVVQPIQGAEGHTYSDDPVEIARLCRMENAKALHVTDLDGLAAGHVVNTDTIRNLVARVDIPIVLGRNFRSEESIRAAFDLGAYRVQLAATLAASREKLAPFVETFGGSRLTLGMDGVEGEVVDERTLKPLGWTAVQAGLAAKSAGIQRLAYSEILPGSGTRSVNLRVLRELASATGLRVTAAGGISNLEALLKIQELEPLGVDSVIIGRALFQNKFSCLGLWRICEARNYPYTAKV
jgi:phosphoribosylformimino-5-aminoimidazole carboxamide ribotide isomerase